MLQAAQTVRPTDKTRLERALAIFTDVRAGEGATTVLMLVNIFLLLICYAVIKTVREPLILLGGGAEVRSYASAGQALLLMGFVPLYSWFASRVDRVRLLVGVTLFFIVCIELFASAVAAGVPYVGVAFFIWVGIFNISLVAQFWSFANDIYTKEAGDRLFPIIVIGMTSGAPIGSLVAGRLFRLGVTPQVILQVSAALLTLSVILYLLINRREERRAGTPEVLQAGDGFRLVFGSPYLRLIAALIVLLNIVNTTGEYLVSKLLTEHVKGLAFGNPGFNAQAFIGAFIGDYQFSVNVITFLLQAFVASRLVRCKGLAGVLLALPLIALGGYAIIAAGVGFTVVRWIKTAENATDYSIMNTARQLLWLPTTREEKYKGKQAIDTLFVRIGDLLSAAAVYVGTSLLHLNVQQFAVGNVVLTLVWLGVALMIVRPRSTATWSAGRRLVPAASAAALMLCVLATPAFAQETRQDQLAAERARKASSLRPYEPDGLERKLMTVEHAMSTERPLYPFIGSVMEGGGFAVGPGYRGRFGDTGTYNAYAAWSTKNYKAVATMINLPTFADGRLDVAVRAHWIDAPSVEFYGVGAESQESDRASFFYRSKTVGSSAKFQVFEPLAIGGGLDYSAFDTEYPSTAGPVNALSPTYLRNRAFAAVDTRTSPQYSRKGGLYLVEWSQWHQVSGIGSSFQRLDAEVRQFVPILRENWVIALRAAASTTSTAARQEVPFFLMPEVGGSHTLRGYSFGRFRDRNRLIMNAEYRWTAGPFVDMAVFFDAGKVTRDRSDLNFHDMRTAHGLGLTIHTPRTTITRIEFARTHEGNAVSLSFSPSF